MLVASQIGEGLTCVLDLLVTEELPVLIGGVYPVDDVVDVFLELRILLGQGLSRLDKNI